MTLVDTVILPVAGRGTRMLPATRAIPKEMLPVFDTPLIQFALDEARALGARRLVVVTHPEKGSIEAYIRSLPLMRRARLETVFTQQEDPKGLGDAVLRARDHVLPGPVGVILPDDLILGEWCLPRMAESYKGGHCVAAQEVAASEVDRYGIFEGVRMEGRLTFQAGGLVEKPAIHKAPSRLAAVGRYLLAPSIFDALARTPPGAGGEAQLTDAIAADAQTGGLRGVILTGRRFDCGSHEGLFNAAAARRRLLLDQEAAIIAAE